MTLNGLRPTYLETFNQHGKTWVSNLTTSAFCLSNSICSILEYFNGMLKVYKITLANLAYHGFHRNLFEAVV